jgi:4-hydroxy-4-methyl-2-oxoglutarate aldolase
VKKMSVKEANPVDALVPDGVLESYAGLRVTDVCDGMDALGMRETGLMASDIRPLWQDRDDFRHRIFGRAYTVRFLPTQRKAPQQSPEEFYAWMSWWYGELAGGPMTEEIRQGDVVVIDGCELGSVGFIGSNNALSWVAAGAVGCVTNGTARDSDELALEGVPVYCRQNGRTIRPGRIELDATRVNVNCGGATVKPGDVVVADGDGVVVVPAADAEAVAEQAWRHARKDKEARRRLYAQLGRAPDWTVA